MPTNLLPTSTLEIQLPAGVSSRLAARATEGGFETVEQFARAVLEAAAEAPDESALSELLAARAADERPGIELTPEYAETFLKDLARRRGRP